MLNFEYKGISAGKYVEGEIEALNNEEAADKLNLFLLASVRVLKLKRFYYLPNSSLL